jgi:hypothetical protein
MEKLAEMLAELRVVVTELVELSGRELNALPQIEAPSCTFAEDRDEDSSGEATAH